MKKFETIYRFARAYVQGGTRANDKLVSDNNFNQTNSESEVCLVEEVKEKPNFSSAIYSIDESIKAMLSSLWQDMNAKINGDYPEYERRNIADNLGTVTGIATLLNLEIDRGDQNG